MNEGDLNWIACALDSEGCIVVRQVTQAKGRPYWTVELRISNTNRKYIEKAAKLCGGKIYEQLYYHNRFGRKQQYYTRLGTTYAQRFLAVVLPYLIVKRQQAQRAIRVPIKDIKTHIGLINAKAARTQLARIIVVFGVSYDQALKLYRKGIRVSPSRIPYEKPQLKR